MSKIAIVIYSVFDNDNARVYRALGTAAEYLEGGDEVTVVFDGAGVESLAAISASDHPLNGLLEGLRPNVRGACSYCAKAHKSDEAITASGYTMLDEHNDHASLPALTREGYTIITF